LYSLINTLTLIKRQEVTSMGYAASTGKTTRVYILFAVSAN